MICTIYYGVGLTKESSKAQKADKKARAFAAKAVLYQMGVCERPDQMRKDEKGKPMDNFDDLIDELGALWA